MASDTINPVGDTYIRSDIGQDINYSAYADFRVGALVKGGTNVYRALFDFDLFATLPINAVVTAATLTLHVASVAASASTARISRITNENFHVPTTTWIQAGLIYPWGTPGGDFRSGGEPFNLPTGADTTSVITGDTLVSFCNFAITDVGGRLMLIAFRLYEDSTSYAIYHSMENGNPGLYPSLQLEYEIPTPGHPSGHLRPHMGRPGQNRPGVLYPGFRTWRHRLDSRILTRVA